MSKRGKISGLSVPIWALRTSVVRPIKAPSSFNKDSVKLIKIFSSICPHFGGPIIYDNKKDEFICKWHGFRFCVKSGKCLSYSIKGSLKDYNHKIKNNKIYLIKDNWCQKLLK